MSAKKKDVFISDEDLSAVTAAKTISFKEFLKEVNMDWAYLQANPDKLLWTIENFGMRNYTKGSDEQAAMHPKIS